MRFRVPFLLVLGVVVGAGASGVGCSSKSSQQPAHTPLTKDQLMDPASCGECHGSHYREWAGSMHAYAADDPLFIAMNARGQRETSGALGTFCVQCHAPLAVQAGATKDGLNLATIDPKLKGITCYYCHSVDAVEGAHNAPAHVADDGVMRGDISDPFDGGAHQATYSKFHDGDQPEAAKMCGTCHDISNPNGVDIARTYTEWQTSLFAHADPKVQLTCPSCHMPGRTGQVATIPGAPAGRRVHDHRMAGVDVALTDFVEVDDQRKAVQANLDPSLVSKLCVSIDAGNTVVEVSLDDAFAGHDWPSGAAYHRRAWAEIIAYDDTGAEIFHSGDVPADQSVTSQVAKEPDLLHFGDQLYAADKPIETLWDATRYESTLLLPAVTNDPKDPQYYHAKITDFTLPSDKQAAKVTSAVHIRPVDYDFVDDLIGSGDLDPSFRTKLSTFTLAGTQLTWTKDNPGLFKCVP